MSSHPSRPFGRGLAALRPTWSSAGSVDAPAWPCTGWGLPGRHVTVTPVRSYRTFSPLPALDSAEVAPSAVCFCGTFPRLSPGRSPDHPALRCPDFPRGAGCLPDLPAAAWPARPSLGPKRRRVDARPSDRVAVDPAIRGKPQRRLRAHACYDVPERIGVEVRHVFHAEPQHEPRARGGGQARPGGGRAGTRRTRA